MLVVVVLLVTVAMRVAIVAAVTYLLLPRGPLCPHCGIEMAALENRLDSARFVRIHRTAIVNRRVLRELRRTGSGGLVAVLATGAELPVARSQQARIRQLR